MARRAYRCRGGDNRVCAGTRSQMRIAVGDRHANLLAPARRNPGRHPTKRYRPAHARDRRGLGSGCRALDGAGCPYEAALALAHSVDMGALRRALNELRRLGARPAAAIVARRLREAKR